MAKADAAAQHLATVPGIGVINATTLVAMLGDGQSFGRGRDLSAWLGLIPRQTTDGRKLRLLGIAILAAGSCATGTVMIDAAHLKTYRTAANLLKKRAFPAILGVQRAA